jgi:hypothetical protein
MHRYILYFASLLTPFLLAAGPNVAILGESYSPENEKFGINVEVLERLFTLINKANPKAVIFTGNMTLGLRKTDNAPVSQLLKPFLNGSELHGWPYPGYTYESNYFQEELTEFQAIKNKTIGTDIPFYPIIADHEAFGPDAITKVLTMFQMKNQAPPDASPLAYTFAIENSLFILFSTVNYNDTLKTTVSHQIPQSLLYWMEEVLKKEKSRYEFIFVVGNEPAFSTTSTTGHYDGLDYHNQPRDILWRMLIKYGVTAYFCAKEHLYDRTNRYGVWQIISGGAGAPFYRREFDKAFYHYLILKLPEKGGLPKVQVFDTEGHLIDEFNLTPTQYPIYQLRVS